MFTFPVDCEMSGTERSEYALQFFAQVDEIRYDVSVDAESSYLGPRINRVIFFGEKHFETYCVSHCGWLELSIDIIFKNW